MKTSKKSKSTLPDGKQFKTQSQRMQLFFIKGTVCATCGIEGTFFSLETHSEKVPPHLNLYAIDENGNDILMTKDHIHPKSKGGLNEISNYQTMCSPCNFKKSDKI